MDNNIIKSIIWITNIRERKVFLYKDDQQPLDRPELLHDRGMAAKPKTSPVYHGRIRSASIFPVSSDSTLLDSHWVEEIREPEKR